ncbi:hypothetical protein LUZ60_003825 [Juncus effusus]|nr:hypothetical protein LUZ60_003825 [Juncus effusus]
MASDSSLKELHATVNEPRYKELNAIDNKSDENVSYSLNTLAPNHSTSTIINQISDILLKDTDEEIISCQEEAAIRATEKLFYDILEQECSSQNQQNLENSGGDGNDKQFDNNSSSTSSSSTSGSICTSDYSDDGFASQIQKGTEEAMKFIPNINELLIGSNKSFLPTKKKEYNDVHVERASKQFAIFADKLIRNEKHERFLHFQGQEYIEEVIALRKLMIKESEAEPKEIKGSESSNTMVRKQTKKRLTGDLRSLLILCSQAISINDHNTANGLIQKIRQHSSPMGDWSERLAHYFVNGLEARLAGTGGEIYRKQYQATAVEFLTAFRSYFVFCPYDRVMIFFSNQAILHVSKNASTVHIIDFCILYGFHWLSLFERFSTRGTTPPKIKITAIDNPQPGFRPATRVEEAGRRLADYARSFNIPFEYNGIVSKLEDFNINELNIEKDEVIVICLSHTQKLGDETTSMGTNMGVDSQRDKLLRNLRRIKPTIFIHGVENSSHSTPFFDTRFKEALFHYSSIFDMLGSSMPHDNEGRFLLESKWLGPCAINAIACEGSERVERPETYRQWQARNTRAGFVQLPVDQEVLKEMRKLVRKLYHKEFFLEEDNNWVLFGWKGRILFAMSTWK